MGSLQLFHYMVCSSSSSVRLSSSTSQHQRRPAWTTSGLSTFHQAASPPPTVRQHYSLYCSHQHHCPWPWTFFWSKYV